jgi:hypothetical protein
VLACDAEAYSDAPRDEMKRFDVKVSLIETAITSRKIGASE